MNLRLDSLHQSIELLLALCAADLGLRAAHRRSDVAAREEVDPVHPFDDELDGAGVDDVLHRHLREPHARPVLHVCFGELAHASAVLEHVLGQRFGEHRELP